MIGRPDTTDHRRRCRLLSLMVRRLINCVSACVLLALAYPRSPTLRRETGTLGSRNPSRNPCFWTESHGCPKIGLRQRYIGE